MVIKEVNIEVSMKNVSPLPANDPSLRVNVVSELQKKPLQPNLLLNVFDNSFLKEHVCTIRICEMIIEDPSSHGTELAKHIRPFGHPQGDVETWTLWLNVALRMPESARPANKELENEPPGFSPPPDITKCDEKEKNNLCCYHNGNDRTNEETPQSESIGGEDDTLAATFLPLPARCLEGLWETLIYDSTIKNQLLQYSKAMLHYSKCGIDPNVINCNRVLLLHGPPGTGKTSLSKAIAQKLSIRLNSSYPNALQIEINTHCLFSKYFSESGKLVSKMFDKIRELAADPQVLLCVLIDEVESLTHSRSASSNGSEPSDAIRVVNAVLTHLDILKTYPNVLTLTTSNITNAIDIAFVDRADLCVLIPNPSAFGVYSILQSCIEELVKAGIVQGPCPPRITDPHVFDVAQTSGDRGCVGMSGRALRKLPLRVHTSILQPEIVATLEDFIKALALAADVVKNEQLLFRSSTSVSS